MQKGNSTSTQFLETLRKRVKKPTQNELAASQLQKKKENLEKRKQLLMFKNRLKPFLRKWLLFN